MLRHIIYAWQDDEFGIPGGCLQAMSPDGKVLVMETVIPLGSESRFGNWLDLMMLLVNGGERTRAGYERLFSASGLGLSRVIPTEAGVSLLSG